MMSDFRVVAISTDIAESVRRQMRAPKYGHPAYRSLADGYGPCRHCLRVFNEGKEDRILFTYDPFDKLEDLPLPGPIFIHAEHCNRYPEGAGFPSDMRSHRLTIDAYGQGRQLIEEVHVHDVKVEPIVERLFNNEKTRYLHVRDAVAGCYDFRIERTQSGDCGEVIKESKC